MEPIGLLVSDQWIPYRLLICLSIFCEFIQPFDGFSISVRIRAFTQSGRVIESDLLPKTLKIAASIIRVAARTSI